MQLKKLSLTNFRAFKQAEFDFQPGMNLIVGINGVGKSSILDAIRVMFSRVMPQISHSKNKPLSFSNNDISIGEKALSVSLSFLLGETSITGLGYRPREEILSTDTVGDVRNQAYSQETRYEFQPNPAVVNMKNADIYGHPLILYFSTSRSVATAESVLKGRWTDPNSDALSDRKLRIRQFADWWLVQQTLLEEAMLKDADIHLIKKMKKRKVILDSTISKFLDGVENLRSILADVNTLAVEKHGKQLNVDQLSDGERGMLALVLDLAQRLIQANPGSDNPLVDGQAIVLIDELDLHLHPRWQRDIVQKLTSTFPKCQFIATTHSPQIVGEVSPDNIIILEADKAPYRPDQSLGMDTNWILRFLMGTDERNPDAKQELENIANLIENEEYDQATAMIDSARQKYGESPELVRLQTRIDRIRLLGE